jgi:hypothetical protein
MAVKFAGKRKTYYFIVPSEDWDEWRTHNGISWENLMGMSWEEMEPPAELQEYWDNEFKDKS